MCGGTIPVPDMDIDFQADSAANASILVFARRHMIGDKIMIRFSNFSRNQ